MVVRRSWGMDKGVRLEWQLVFSANCCISATLTRGPCPGRFGVDKRRYPAQGVGLERLSLDGGCDGETSGATETTERDMASNTKPPGGRYGKDGEVDPSEVEIIAMTIRHGADRTKRYLDALARLKACEEDDAHA
jgi:hypothetical protein